MHHHDSLVKLNVLGGHVKGLLTTSCTDRGEGLLCIPGFCRSAVSEQKFRVICRQLASKFGVNSLRFDFIGTGISDGDLNQDYTIADLTEQVGILYEYMLNQYSRISIIAHSLGAYLVANAIDSGMIAGKPRMVLLAPALAQPALQKRWDKGSPHPEEKKTRYGIVPVEHFIVLRRYDRLDVLKDKENVLHIHGDQDQTVPLELTDLGTVKRLIVQGGNHDLEMPDQLDQWLPKAIEFITG